MFCVHRKNVAADAEARLGGDSGDNVWLWGWHFRFVALISFAVCLQIFLKVTMTYHI